MFLKTCKNAIFCWCPRSLRFWCLVPTQSEKKKTGGVYQCKMYLFLRFKIVCVEPKQVFISTLASALWKTNTGINNCGRFLCRLMESKSGLSAFFCFTMQIWCLLKVLDKSIQKQNAQKWQSCLILWMFRVLCRVGGLLNRKFKGLNAYEFFWRRSWFSKFSYSKGFYLCFSNRAKVQFSVDVRVFCVFHALFKHNKKKRQHLPLRHVFH